MRHGAKNPVSRFPQSDLIINPTKLETLRAASNPKLVYLCNNFLICARARKKPGAAYDIGQ